MAWQDGTARALPDGEGPRSTVSLELSPKPASVPQARNFVREAVRGLDAELVDTALLLTSELVTNAVIHARTELVVAVVRSDAHVAVTVHDLDLGRREQREGERDGGRGLSIVAALACAHGQDRHLRGGKTSWFRLCLAQHDRLTHHDQGVRA